MSENIPTHAVLCVDNIFKSEETYFVPPYQRGYAWTDEQVEQLLTDLLHAYAEKPDEYYLLGQSIVCRTDSSWEVVDGQQRLTTLFILLTVGFRTLDSESQSFDPNRKARYALLPVAVQNVDNDDTASPRMLVAKTGRHYIECLVKGEQLPAIDTDSTQENIRTAYELIVEALDSNFDSARAKFDFIYFVLKRVILVRLELANRNHALRVFQKVNDRGLALDDADLLKNLLFIKADDNDFAYLSKAWDDANQALFKSRLKRLRSMEFLMKCLIGIRTGKSIPSTEVFETWEKELEDLDEAKRFAQSLENKATVILNASMNKTPSGLDTPYTPGTFTFKWVQHFEVLLAGAHLDSNSYTYLADIVENRAMLSMLAREKNQDFERLVHKWAHKISMLDPDSNRTSILAASTDALGNLANLIEDMRTEVPKLSYEVQSQRNKIRYALARISQEIELEANNFTLPNELLIQLTKPTPRGQKKYHLDHVFPKSAAQRPQWDNTEKSSLINSIGNLVLLHPHDNQEQGDKLPSSPEKIVNLQNSKLLINQILCQQASGAVWQPRVMEVFKRIQAKQAPVIQHQQDSESGSKSEQWGSEAVLARTNVYLDILASAFEKSLS